ncbi:MAG: hypothetical protein AAF485_18460, partial [Chloroflexota bacterium]
LHEIEQRIETLALDQIPAEFEAINTLEQEIQQQGTPPQLYMGEFYNLKLHIQMISNKLAEREKVLQTGS